MQRIRENKQNRVRHYISAPKRFLRKARDLYVDSLVTFDGKVGSANIVACPTTHASHMPKSLGGYSSTKLDKDGHLQHLYRSISNKYSWNSNIELDKPLLKQTTNGYVAMDRSYSIALGKIGRIDEEEPCQFQEHVAIKGEMMFPRSRSHAVTRNNGYY